MLYDSMESDVLKGKQWNIKRPVVTRGQGDGGEQAGQEIQAVTLTLYDDDSGGVRVSMHLLLNP